MSEEEVYKIIMKSSSKSCSLDPIPIWLPKKCIGTLLPRLLKANNLFSERQSAYRKHYSTYTAFIRISSDILEAVDTHGEVILIGLDSSI